MKICFTKNCLKRALRTFLQTAVGYIVTNLAMYFGDLDFANEDLLKKAVSGIVISAVAAGLSAVMNLEKKAEISESVEASTTEIKE
ncbi:MAG: hypothetical protein UH080_06545 [Ruminococcus sp.]|nr:hypothetical protein [Ruminococcus sp.]